jgi:hypothetical protein
MCSDRQKDGRAEIIDWALDSIANPPTKYRWNEPMCALLMSLFASVQRDVLICFTLTLCSALYHLTFYQRDVFMDFCLFLGINTDGLRFAGRRNNIFKIIYMNMDIQRKNAIQGVREVTPKFY